MPALHTGLRRTPSYACMPGRHWCALSTTACSLQDAGQDLYAVRRLQLVWSDNRVFTGAAPTLLCSATSHCTRCLGMRTAPRRTLSLLAPWEIRHARPVPASAADTSTAGVPSAPPAALHCGTERHSGRSLRGLAPLCAAGLCGLHTVRCRPFLRRNAREPAGVTSKPACQRQCYELATT